jgi:hypothetical protein
MKYAARKESFQKSARRRGNSVRVPMASVQIEPKLPRAAIGLSAIPPRKPCPTRGALPWDALLFAKPARACYMRRIPRSLIAQR